jgi:hypothetical protein
MKTNNTLKKNLYGILLSLLTPMVAQADAVLYQQDFSSYSGSITTPASVGWQYPWNDGFQITDQGTGTGMSLWHIGGFSSPMSPVSSNATKIVVKSLLWPQTGSANAGLTSTGFNNFGSGSGAYTATWYGFGPRLQFSGGNLSILRGGNEGGDASAAVAVSGATAGNADFSLVIDVATGLADAYFGSPETGTLLIDDFDLKGTSDLATWQANVRSMNNFIVWGNQAIHDNLSVSEIAQSSTVYQQDFRSYSGLITTPASVGWQFPWNDGFQITDQGTGTGMCLWHIGGFSHALTSPINANASKIVVKSLLWPQTGSATAGLTSTGFNNFGSGSGAYTDAWYGYGPRLQFSGGNLSILRGGSEGGDASTAVAVSGATAGNADFSLVIDVTTGLADAYFGSPETGTLLINDYDLKGPSDLATWQANVRSMSNFVVWGNQAINDNMEVITFLPEFSTFASWSAAFAGGQTAELDWDNDGVSNGVEFFMNAAPGFTANPGLVGNTVTWTNGGNIPSTGYGTQFVVQISTNLVTWDDVTEGDFQQFGTNTASSLSYTLDPANNPGKQFVRLKVTP